MHDPLQIPVDLNNVTADGRLKVREGRISITPMIGSQVHLFDRVEEIHLTGTIDSSSDGVFLISVDWSQLDAPNRIQSAGIEFISYTSSSSSLHMGRLEHSEGLLLPA